MRQKVVFVLVLAAATMGSVLWFTPLRASVADDNLDALFRNTYVYQTWLADDAIRVEADNGVVILSGSVAAEPHKVLAQETVASLQGVARVDNRLATRAEAAAAHEDILIGKRVKLALEFHRNVSGDRTSVAVKDGVVTLGGEATSLAQKELTAEYTRDIEGVTEVNNTMDVVRSPRAEHRSVAVSIDDASVTAQVRVALFVHHSTRSLKTTVHTKSGEVTLSGGIRSAADKIQVTKLVNDIHGVNSVRNLMTVETPQAP